MAVSSYVIAICLLAATFTPVRLSSSTTAQATTTDASTDSSSVAQSTAASTAASATTAANNISCHQYSCEERGCLKAAIDNSSITTQTCYTVGKCLVKRTSNDSYTKEEAECTTASCSTTIHNDGDGKQVCCSTDDCNGDANVLNAQSNAPSLSYTIALIFSLFVMCLNRFWNLKALWYILNNTATSFFLFHRLYFEVTRTRGAWSFEKNKLYVFF